MPTRPRIDDRLLAEAQRLGGLGTKGETINAALREFVARRKPHPILELFGRLDWDPGYDYKRERSRR